MVQITDEQLQALINQVQSKQQKVDEGINTKQLWKASWKEANKILELYESGYDKKELGRKPDLERLALTLFKEMLHTELQARMHRHLRSEQ